MAEIESRTAEQVLKDATDNANAEFERFYEGAYAQADRELSEKRKARYDKIMMAIDEYARRKGRENKEAKEKEARG
jgi:hypothetical protein